MEALLDFIARSPSPYHAARAGEETLRAAGFSPLVWGRPWRLETGGRYYARAFGSALLAFTVGARGGRGLRIAAAHTDFPGFRVKPAAGMARDGYGLVNVEPYGGLILSSWLDRPLSLAGEVALRSADAFAPELRLVDFARPLMTIPRLAIHMNRKVNESETLDRQTSMTPVAALLREGLGGAFFLDGLARELGCGADDILAYDLNVYPAERGCTLGMEGTLISAPRLDNLASVHACLEALCGAADGDGVRAVALFDHEEVGSRAKDGADSSLLPRFLEAVYRALGLSAEALARDAAEGFLLSVDAAHGLHPNYEEKADPTNRPRLGGGVVLKRAASQSYAGDAASFAVVAALAQERSIPYQTFANRSSLPGGATLGSLAAARLGIRAQDIGVPLLAMHAARELAAADDQRALTRLLAAFFA